MCRLVTIDVALPISFSAEELGLGHVSLSIRVHTSTFLIILILGLSRCM